MSDPEIVYVRWGSGYLLKNRIHLNRRLLDYPELHGKVLDHELRHYNGERGVDRLEPWDWDIFVFKLQHPCTWVDLLPVWVHGRVISIDWHRAYFWIGVCIGFVCLYVLKRYFV